MKEAEVSNNHIPISWLHRSQALKRRIMNRIDGHEWAGGGTPFEKYSPRDGRALSHICTADSADVDRAVSSARKAFEDGRWSKLSFGVRKKILHNLASLIDGNREEFALLECLDVGKPIYDALNIDVPTAADLIRYSAESSDKLMGKVYGVNSCSLSYDLHRPLGVVAAVVGWNFPLILAAGKIGPALAMGNSLVLKPSELTSFSAARLAELALEAGVPEGVFNVIHGGGTVGAALAMHRGVDLLTFTGSSQTGKKLLIAAGESNMKRLILECGGKAPNIVFDDSPDLNSVADAVLSRAFWNQGQVCTASSRLLVQKSIKTEFTSMVVEKAAALIPRDPLDPEARFGAVVSESHQRKIHQYIEAGKLQGARTVLYSNPPPPCEGGYYVAPVIFDDVTPDQKIAQEEIFGPVLSVMTFHDEEEAIRIANSTIYGLSAILWTRDLSRAHRVTHAVKAGWITVNATGKPTGELGVGALSVGGHKESGLGIEGGLEGLEAYTSRTAVQLFIAN